MSPRRSARTPPATSGQPTNAGAASRRRTWLLFPLIALVTLLAYQPAWHGEPVWDDDAHMTAPELRSADSLRRIWFEVGATQQYYPVVHSTFWVLHRLWGDETLGYHLLNILLHATSACLVVLILWRLSAPGAILAGVLFALHPVHVESVAWISELKNTLSGAFFLAAAWYYLAFDESRRPQAYAVSLLLFVAALLSKSVTATLPAALLVVIWWKRGTISWRADVRPLLPFFAAGIAAGLGTVWVERTFIGAAGGDFELSVLERTLLASRAVWFYLSKLIWPSNLTFIYPRWHISASDPLAYAYLAGVVVLLVTLWRLRGCSRAPLAAALLFGGMLFPALGFFNVFPFRYSYVADHFQYLASIAPLALASGGLALLLRRVRPDARSTEAAAVVLAIPLFVLTWHQSAHYADAETLYRATLARNPACGLCHNHLGVMALEAPDGSIDEALRHTQEALRLNPGHEESHNNLGVILRRLGRNDEAIPSLEEAVRLSPNYPDARLNLGLALEDAGRREDALVHYLHVTRLAGRAAEGHARAGAALLALGRADEAIPHLDAALRAGPAPDVYANLGIALARQGRDAEAVEIFRDGVRVAPADADARRNLGAALMRAGRPAEAVTEYREALRLAPGSARAHDDLGEALVQAGDRPQAATHFEEALRLDPDYAPAHVNVANLLVDAGRPQDAVQFYLKALEMPDEIDEAQVHSNLGVAYAMTGRSALAVRHFREALRIRPDFREAQANLERALAGR
jgi:protein O-mannosyl-transferase